MSDDRKGKGAEQRAHPRVDFLGRVKVCVPDSQTAIDTFAGNVSQGGIFLRSNRPLPRGQKVSLEFDTPKGKVRIDEGEVVWNKPFEPISVDGAAPGMGVQFRSMSEASRDAIEAFIAEELSRIEPLEAADPPPARPPVGPLPPPPRLDLAPPLSDPPRPPVPLPPAEPSLPAPEQAAPARLKIRFPPERGPSAGAYSAHRPGGDRIRDPAPRAVAAQQDPEAFSPEPIHAPKSGPRAAEGAEMAELSRPPPTRTRLLVFGGFVILVALITFFTLVWLGPLGNALGVKTADHAGKPADAAGKGPTGGAVSASGTGPAGGAVSASGTGPAGGAVSASGTG
ncbi:MAG: PilZ domain-containing protein, partial [Deltaproteobacteria bacterium]|nr:PilZ domain-containing protein [Deltaproteobacteria bacterium]